MSQHHPHDNMKNGLWLTLPKPAKQPLLSRLRCKLAHFKIAIDKLLAKA